MNLEVRFFSKSFKEAITALEINREISSAWTWSRVHVVEYEHPLGKVAMFRKIFNVGPLKFVLMR
jgi:penicillin amidase